MVVSFRSLRGGLHLMPGAPERDGSSALPFAASCAQQLCHRAQIHSGHNQSNGKSMPVAMPGILFDFGLFEYGWKPAALPLRDTLNVGRIPVTLSVGRH